EQEIASKTGLTFEYVRSVIKLLDQSEHRLLRAVEAGRIPISIAVAIAGSDDEDVQDVLQQAYEKKLLRGNKLIEAKRLVDSRRIRGRGLRVSSPLQPKSLSVDDLLKTYRESAENKRRLIAKAAATKDRLLFIAEALRNLLRAHDFVSIL